MQTKVLTISGITAGGKTTLSRALLNLQPEIKIIAFDDYSIDALPGAPSFDFFKENPLAAINQYDLSALINDFDHAYGKFPLILLDFLLVEHTTRSIHSSIKPAICKLSLISHLLVTFNGNSRHKVILRRFSTGAKRIFSLSIPSLHYMKKSSYLHAIWF